METRLKPLLDAKNVVGESIIYDDRNDTLYWVDIIASEIHALSLASEEHRVWLAPEIVTSIGLRTEGGFVVGLAKSITTWAPDGPFEAFASVEPELPDNRLNEGVVGPDGALWVGTMQNNINSDGSPRDISAATGRIYRVMADGSVRRLSDDTFGISNTLAWPRDDRLLVADTLENQIYSYRWDAASSAISDRKTYLGAYPRGLPDGSCLDAEGYLWNCRVVGGNCVVRVDPDGEIERVVELPCSWPTSCTFGGAEFGTLYVTSARFTQSPEHLAAAPWEGGLFAVDVGVRGRPSHRFG